MGVRTAGLEAGEWTDDTSMALALADSIRTAGWDLTDQARRYVDWWKNGRYSVSGRCFDIGGTTAAALRRFLASGDPRTSGLGELDTAGNCSIMRLAPVAIAASHRYPDDVARLVERVSSRAFRPTALHRPSRPAPFSG